MGKVFHFSPRAALVAEKNLELFIAQCRDELTVFGEDLIWQENVWPGVAVFSKLGFISRKLSPEMAMNESYIHFAKAYLRYQQGHKPTKAKNELKALRAVEAALIQVSGEADVSNISTTVMDEAAQLGISHYSTGAAYDCGRELERLAKFLSLNSLIPKGISGWVNPIKRPSSSYRTGIKAKKIREEKLPSSDALSALAEVFANNPSDPRDIFTSSVFALLMSAPSRISEVLSLPVDCEVTEIDRKGVSRYGWRFFAGKGYDGDIKWIPSVMESIAREAIRRLKVQSESARKFAKWVEENPTKFYRHENCPNVSDKTPLTLVQACNALGLSPSRSSLYMRGLSDKNYAHTLDSLWRHVVYRLPEGFPWFDKSKGIKFSNAMFSMCKNALHKSKGALPTELHRPTGDFFNNDLSPRESLGKAHSSIFDRHNYRDIDGNRLKITSHQVRHLLNTIAQRGGLSNLEIAKWSGRADVRQNRTYNHMTEYEMVAMAEQLGGATDIYTPLGKVDGNLPMCNGVFNTLEHAAVHVTEFGFCVHDYTLSPCEKFRDCVNCTEQVCIKGNEENLQRIKDRLSKSEDLLLRAKQAMVDDYFGSDRWYQYHDKTVNRLRELVNILEDSKVEIGSQIKLKGNDFSQLRRVIEKKAIGFIDENGIDSAEVAIFEELTSMLEGKLG
ncbi:integrase [Vibrio metschnikovii]|uniref:integrase n=1 Tax=Vibrio metschnikovii TaxID=28172 RepID=UPI002FCC43D3